MEPTSGCLPIRCGSTSSPRLRERAPPRHRPSSASTPMPCSPLLGSPPNRSSPSGPTAPSERRGRGRCSRRRGSGPGAPVVGRLAGRVAGGQVLEPRGAVVEAAPSVSGEPQLAVAVDERAQLLGERVPYGLGHRREGAVAFEAGAFVARDERHECRALVSLVGQEIAVGSPGGGGGHVGDGVVDDLVDPVELGDVETAEEPAAEVQLWPVERRDERGDVRGLWGDGAVDVTEGEELSLIHISEPTRRTPISYAVFCLKKKQ